MPGSYGPPSNPGNPPYPPGASYPGQPAPHGDVGAQAPYGNPGAQPPYGHSDSQPPYGYPGPQAPYGSPGAQAPYGSPGAQAPYGYPGAQAPFGSPGSQAPFGYPSPPPGNGRAVAGFILGCLAVVLSVLTLLDVPLIILGAVFSILGLRAARAGRGQRKLAIAGLVLSIIGAAAVVAIGIVLIERVQHCQQLHPRGTTAFNQCVPDFSQ